MGHAADSCSCTESGEGLRAREQGCEKGGSIKAAVLISYLKEPISLRTTVGVLAAVSRHLSLAFRNDAGSNRYEKLIPFTIAWLISPFVI